MVATPQRSVWWIPPERGFRRTPAAALSGVSARPAWPGAHVIPLFGAVRGRRSQRLGFAMRYAGFLLAMLAFGPASSVIGGSMCPCLARRPLRPDAPIPLPAQSLCLPDPLTPFGFHQQPQGSGPCCRAGRAAVRPTPGLAGKLPPGGRRLQAPPDGPGRISSGEWFLLRAMKTCNAEHGHPRR